MTGIPNFGEAIKGVEHRAADRHLLAAQGWIQFGPGHKLAMRTLDISSAGVSFVHDEKLPGSGSQGLLIAQVLDDNGEPATFRSETVVLYSIFANGRIRSGATFGRMSDNNRALLARVLEGKRRSQRPIVLDAPGPDLAF
jgi:hypothetical protein